MAGDLEQSGNQFAILAPNFQTRQAAVNMPTWIWVETYALRCPLAAIHHKRGEALSPAEFCRLQRTSSQVNDVNDSFDQIPRVIRRVFSVIVSRLSLRSTIAEEREVHYGCETRSTIRLFSGYQAGPRFSGRS